MKKTSIIEVMGKIMPSSLKRAGVLLPRHSTDSDMTPSDSNEIFVNERGSDIDENELKEMLIPFVRIGKDTGRISLTKRFDGLSGEQKVIVILFAEKLRTEHMNTEYNSDDYLSPNKISKLAETSMKHLYPSIQKLEQERILDYEQGRYRIDPSQIAEARNILREISD